MFADNIEIEVSAGKGGDGRLSFRHEKYRAKGGPDGGDGGAGGSVVLRVDHNLNTLGAFRTRRRIEADPGAPGGGNRSHGKNGADVIVAVPSGTMVFEGDTKRFDLTEEGQQTVVARGGRGGFGNAHFTSSTRQAPRLAELGEPGERFDLRLELKLVADVGLVGLPNAGKSTLLSVISNARPEIANYAFTTLVPNLGVAPVDDATLVVADIPGLIAGASAGKGLGDEFLRHIERTAVLLHLVDVNSSDIAADYRTIQAELKAHGSDLTTKPQLVVVTKAETMTPARLKPQLKALAKATKAPVYVVSAAAHQGLTELLRATRQAVERARTQAAATAAAETKVYDLSNVELPAERWQVDGGAGHWIVRGEAIEGFARRSDASNPAAIERLRHILRRQGIINELEKRGLAPGDTIEIGSLEIEW